MFKDKGNLPFPTPKLAPGERGEVASLGLAKHLLSYGIWG